MLAIDLVGAAHLLGEVLAPAQFVEFALPPLLRRAPPLSSLGIRLTPLPRLLRPGVSFSIGAKTNGARATGPATIDP